MTVPSTNIGPSYSVKSGSKPKGPPQRRDYGIEFKLRIVKETLAPGASVSVIARRHDLNSNLVFRWRREYRNGELTRRQATSARDAGAGFVPVGVVDQQGALLMLPPPENESADSDKATGKPPPAGRSQASVIEIVLLSGIRLRVGAHVDDCVLRRVLSAVKDLS